MMRNLANRIDRVALLVAALVTTAALTHVTLYADADGPFPPSPVTFEQPGQAVQMPFTVIDNNMFVTVKVNDSAELNVAFDSGLPFNGILILDSTLGEQLKLTYVGVTPLGGGGEDAPSASVATGGAISVPGARFTDQQILVVTSSHAFKDWPCDGIVGGTFLNSCIIQIDHDNHVMNLYDPELYEQQPSGEEHELTFSMGIPVVTAKVRVDDSMQSEVKLLFDTGADVPIALYSNMGIDFFAPADAQECYVSEGIGGPVHGKWGRVELVQVGRVRLDDVLAFYPTKGFEDVISLLGQNGFFGFGLQTHFNITFDYRNRRVFLEPNQRYNEAFEFNMAGLVLRTQRDGYWRVHDVLAGSPGEESGIQIGDIIVSIDAVKTPDLSNSERDEVFLRDGRVITVDVKRESRSRSLQIKLKRLI